MSTTIKIRISVLVFILSLFAISEEGRIFLTSFINIVITVGKFAFMALTIIAIYKGITMVKTKVAKVDKSIA